MRILHVIYDDIGNPWVGGGGAFRTLELYSRMARGGERITVVCGKFPRAADRETRGGVQYRHVGYPKQYVLSRLTYMLWAARLIKQGGYDIVIEDVSPFSPVGVPLWAGKTPCVASVQNTYGAHTSLKYGLLGWGPRGVEKPLLSLFKNFVATSPQVAAELRALKGPGAEIRTIRYSAGPIFFSAGHMPGGPDLINPYILSIGRLDVYQKGLDRLITAFDGFAGRVPTVKLLIAGGTGSGQMFKLDNLVAASKHRNRIRFVGQVDQTRAAALMKNALLVAIPSRYETGPITALEAGAAGVPVVGTDIPGLRDNAPPYPKGHGMLVPENDPEALIEAMYKVATDLNLRAAMGEAGKIWADQFTWDRLAQEQLTFYKEVVLKRET